MACLPAFVGEIENPMPRISGRFDVTATPQSDAAPIDVIARMALDKTFHGALNGPSHGQMLAYRTATQGSAGYVAMEQFSGTLAARRGSFVLQHSGLMARGQPTLTLVVVPDSGTDELTGLSGRMDIRIESGDHYYDFDYELA